MAIEKNQSLAKQTSRTIGLLDLVIEQFKLLKIAYKENNLEMALKIQKNDYNINIEFQYIIDKASWILSQHTFLGEELRKIIGYNSIAKEFERLADVVSGIAGYLVKWSPTEGRRKDIIELIRTIESLLSRLRGSIEAPKEEEIITFANDVVRKVVFYEKRKKDYIKKMAKESNTKKIEKIINEILLAKRIQNMSSFIVNSCEYLLYIVTGKNIDL